MISSIDVMPSKLEAKPPFGQAERTITHRHRQKENPPSQA
jgi:hypothetical protein